MRPRDLCKSVFTDGLPKDQRTDRRMDGTKDGPTEGRTDRPMDGPMDGETHALIETRGRV